MKKIIFEGGDKYFTSIRSKKRANNKWVEANYKRFNLALPKEEAEIIASYCKEKNISKNSFFREAAKEKMEREN